MQLKGSNASSTATIGASAGKSKGSGEKSGNACQALLPLWLGICEMQPGRAALAVSRDLAAAKFRRDPHVRNAAVDADAKEMQSTNEKSSSTG